MKTTILTCLMALLGAGAHAAQPSDTDETMQTIAAADTPLDQAVTGHDCPCLTDRDCQAPTSAAEETTMKLTELDPKWITAEGRAGLGVAFDCPCAECRAASDDDRQRVAVFFDQPLDGLPQIAAATKTWQRAGATFDDLTLSPSIRFMARDLRGDPSRGLVEHWHGFIRGGQVTS